MTSLYLHIPFCRTKCPYCAFSSFAGMTALHSRYLAALKKELWQIARSRRHPPLDTLFIGGGTPTVVGSDALCDLLHHCRQLFGLHAEGEFTIEANPGTVQPADFTQLRQAGFNRLSLGVQSLANRELQILGRSHNRQDALDAVQATATGGFTSISLDLMYGLPNQTASDWQENLQTALRLPIEHLSLYQLTIEEDTPFFRDFHLLEPRMPSEEEILAMDAINLDLCQKARFEQYEISNFARPGRRCRHNVNYWHNGEYLAAGSGAVSYVDGRREKRLLDPLQYCQAVEDGISPIDQSEQLDKEAAFREAVVLGLRMNEGVSIKRLMKRYGISADVYYAEIFEKLMDVNLIHLDEDRLVLTDRGRLLANQVMMELV